MESHLELFKKCKPKVQFAISVMTIWIKSGPILNRIYSLFGIINNITFTFFLSLNALKVFEETLTTNTLTTVILLIAMYEILTKNLTTCFNAKSWWKLLDWIQSLHEQIIEDVDLKSIVQDTLSRYAKLWLKCYK